MLLLIFFYFLSFLFIIFHFSSETGQRTKTKIEVKDDPYLERIETKFQRDPLRGFQGSSIFNIQSSGCMASDAKQSTW